ncbi:MAG: hypothetical protein KC613_09165 [Myxococcales bacterium]|nr:hypothetical protein [Myxococcales bacterium]MCB9522356.1 hypothetical protein [Myxococcales bacterium]
MFRLRWLSIAFAVGLAPAVGIAAEGEDEVQDVREIGILDQETLDRAETLFFSGLEHYRKGRFEEAAVAFQQAFALTRHRDLLFNVARSREQIGDKGGAIEWYRAYLATEPADETAIIHRIQQLGGDPSPAKPAEVKAKVDANRPPDVEVVEEGAGVLPWVVLGAGVAAAATGAVFGFQALDDASKARAADRRGPAQAYKADAEQSALLADISFGLAAVGVGVAAWLWLDADQAKAEGQVQVGALPGGGLVGWTGRF